MGGATRSRLAVAGMLGVISVGVPVLRAADVSLEELDQKVRIVDRKLELADEAAAAKATETPAVTAGPDGFALSAADKSFQLKLRGYAQADCRFFFEDDKKATDAFVLRRARVILDGRLGKPFEFRVAPDFGGGKAELQDGYLDFHPADWLNVRFGRTKVPFGMERLQSSADTLFNETALSTALTPNYDTGVQLYGSLAGGALDYALGAYNGGPDGASMDSDPNDAKDLVARLLATPFAKHGPAWLRGLSLGVAGTLGEQQGDSATPGLPSFRTAGQQTFFSYKTSTNLSQVAYADGNRLRLAPQVYYSVGAFGFLGEYVTSEQKVANGAGADTLGNEGWQATASYVLTGETPSLKGVKPARPFATAKGGWGALELAARLSALDVDDAAFERGYADSKKSSSEAGAAGIGLNWYLTRHAKFVVDYEQTSFTGGAASSDRPDEKVVIARAHVSF